MPCGATKPTHHNERNPKHCKEDPVQPKLKEKKEKRIYSEESHTWVSRVTYENVWQSNKSHSGNISMICHE